MAMKFKFYRISDNHLVQVSPEESMFLRYNPFDDTVESLNVGSDSYIPCHWCNGHGCSVCNGSGQQILNNVSAKLEDNSFWHKTQSYIVVFESDTKMFNMEK